jgi:cell division cycle 2-like
LCQQLINIIDLLGIPDDVSLMLLGIDAGAPSKLREKVPEERLSAAVFDVLHGLLQYDPRTGSLLWRRCGCHGLHPWMTDD